MRHDTVRPCGILEITERNIETGEIIYQQRGNNIITSTGMNQIFRSFTDPNFDLEYVETISLGNDVGNGTVLNPQQPTIDTTSANHSSVFTVPLDEFFISYPTGNSVRFFATVNGATVMDLYPSEPNIVYTSAMLTTLTGKAFCYRRFSGRTISALISVDISWTIEFTQE